MLLKYGRKTRHSEKNIRKHFDVISSPIFQTKLHDSRCYKLLNSAFPGGFRGNDGSVKRRIKIQLVAQRKQRRGSKASSEKRDSSLKLRRLGIAIDVPVIRDIAKIAP